MSAETPRSTCTLVVLQPGYLPWLGFFDQLRRSDVFVLYDDVQFDKHGWRNRNRIKSPHGPHWLTVPVRHSGLDWPRINEVEIDNRLPWARKQLGSISHFYAHAAFREQYLPELESILSRNWQRLIDLDLAVIEQMCCWLGIQKRMLLASELQVGGLRSERLLGLCERVGATRYLTGSAARSYLDVDLFVRAGVQVEWQDYDHPVYPQQHGAFVPYLSALDLLLNCGDASAAIIEASSSMVSATVE